MPMLKTAPSGKTNITNIQAYLLDQLRQEATLYRDEYKRYEAGEVQLSDWQVGYLRDYLGEHSRGLSIDVSDDLSTRNWARQMDLTRAQHNHNQKTSRGKSRSYYHFILSPDPDDACTLSTLRHYAQAWAEKNFRNNDRLCQYAIVPHDDNTKGVLHAHIVVNVTNMASGRKLHLDNDEVVALQISAQEIGKQFGLSPIREMMNSTLGTRTEQPVYLDKKEREILNKGGYSWKWELRKIISEVAPLSQNFEDFRHRLNRLGYDVKQAEETGFLTYTHKNGNKVKDCRIGARFYLESLEKQFNQEQEKALTDKTYANWELIKISRGEIPWKEEIRRAVDQLVPMVLSVDELRERLLAVYGVHLIINRRGITYQHACGFKTRDISLGFRYTSEGLQQNAVVGMALPYPGYRSIIDQSTTLAKHYMPRSVRGIDRRAGEGVGARFIYADFGRMMERLELERVDEVAPVLEDAYQAVQQQKNVLSGLRQELLRFNHLSSLLSRYEQDEAYLRLHASTEISDNTDDATLYNDTLLRYQRIGLYLKEQAPEIDVRQEKEELAAKYQKELDLYQERLSDLERDTSIYRNYLASRSQQPRRETTDSNSGEAVTKTSSLFAASRTLSKHRIRDYFQLEQVIGQQSMRFELSSYRLEKALDKLREQESIVADIRTCQETKPYMPSSAVLEKAPRHLDIEDMSIRFNDASRRLAHKGIKEADFDIEIEKLLRYSRAVSTLEKEKKGTETSMNELKEADEICRNIAGIIKSQSLTLEPSKKSTSSGEGTAVSAEKQKRQPTEAVEKNATSVLGALPIEEAKRRRRERTATKQSPEVVFQRDPERE